ncbi:MAG: type II toxin-antitoxin system RelE/ParE family toxin [Cellvibrio sp.]|uniref:type II toxin-antitoxin system RelE/ParE family toxin n=1 Tax=Cellvibrio sp. TaxID=1965322 RepID=UPI0027289B89|nr:type II toxin-antitoxin system RelE/ParE family toxin [Cellvibrio sp.]
MLPVIWLASAAADLIEIVRYIAAENPVAARKLKQRIEDAVVPLSEHPYLYRSSERVPGVREMVVHPNYLVFYRVTHVNIEIVAVVHARREYPNNTGAPI